MKTVGMLTTFVGFLESYSLCQVARTQLKMLKQNGYDCRFIFRGGDRSEWEQFTSDIRTIPDYIVDNDGSSKDMETRSGKSFVQMVMETAQALESVLEGLDVVITHDLIYQSSNNIQDAACALYAEKHPNVIWLHWVHSATSPLSLNKRTRHKYANSFVVYPNAWDVPRVARNFGYEEDRVKVVPHPMDFVEFFDMHPLTEALIDKVDLLSADVIACYPLRMDRGKQPEFCIRILNGMRTKYLRLVRLVIIDFQSTGGDKVTYRRELKDLAKKLGWADNELTFMSEFDSSCFLQTPKKVVRDLMLLSNVYIHPSKSETYSLTTQEARACKNLLVLNFDFPAMRSIYGEGPLYRKFSSAVNMSNGEDGETTTRYQPNVDAFAEDVAGNVLYAIDSQAVLRSHVETRQNKNMRAVFKRHIEPLFYGLTVK